jgi:hypothetical protein
MEIISSFLKWFMTPGQIIRFVISLSLFAIFILFIWK